ncbi:hypothetical protein O6H91_05G083700 [Diphasiastrum complanatum]|uniref:Uncharacterized protein n=1 Tax=Diphasiastrum complanatum TaxID=34168 RepID=A0ACC2DQ51_DIPCM|nr:hypothetical protein O6H91_05G083700 [Diphasiastrum complanatum]
MGWGRSRKSLAMVALGQVLSLLITGTGFTSSLLAQRGIDAPTAQAWSNYILLALIYGGLVVYRRKKIEMPWYSFILLAFIDVEANYLAVKAYQYTSLTSVMLLDCWTIPFVIILTWLLLKTHYSIGHFVGVGICVLGLVLVIFSDVHASDRSGGKNVLLGDMLVFGSSILYAISNVSEEFLVKHVEQVELVACLSSFGAVISAFQLYMLEWHEIRRIHWTTGAILPFIGFAFSQFGFYTLVPILLQGSGSALLNLSILTSDMWAVAIRAFVFRQRVDWLYFVAFGTVAGGLLIYSLCGEPVAADGLVSRENPHVRENYEPVKVIDADLHDAGAEEEQL